MALEKADRSTISRYVRDTVDRLPPKAMKAVGIGRVTGTPQADTPPATDSSDRLATTAFIGRAISALVTGVSSVFGRTGAVTAQTGDYTAAQVTNAADKAAAATQIFTGAIATGSSLQAFPTTTTFWAASGNGQFFAAGAAAGNSTLHTYIADGVKTGWSYYIAADGTQNWGPGNATADTSLFRGTAGAPGGTAVGLQTGSRVTTTSTAGFNTVSPVNNTALATWLLAADTQPAFKIFQQGAMIWGVGGSTAPDIELARIVNSPTGTGSFLEIINGDGFGYGTGTGGTVTQGTSLSTGVTLSRPSGQITLFSSSISAGLVISFVVTNANVGADDTVVLSGINMAGIVMSVSNVAAGSFTITWHSPGALSSATRRINFAVIKGATA